MARDPDSLAALGEKLLKRGLPLTIQRRVIFESLDGRTDHPTADQIYESARDEIPGISRTTVYRVLETLVEIGMVRRVDHPGASARFDPRTDHHHHLTCTECLKVVDCERLRTEKITAPSVRKTGFEITDYSIHFTGVCKDCRTAPPSS